MKRTSETWTQLDWVDTLNATSSQGSAAGATRCGLPVGPTTAPSGRDLALASLSARQAEERGLLTSGTSGRTGTISSASADLQSSLESRLRARTASGGSTLYALTWKDRATPSGRLICALRASVRRISDKDSGLLGWPTPAATTYGENLDKEMARRARLREQHGNGNGAGMTTALAAQMAGWPTPNTPSGGRSVSIEKMDATGRTFDGKKHTASLEHAVKFTGWPTPTTRDHKDTGDLSGSMFRRDGQLRDDTVPRVAWLAGPARLTATGEMLTGSSAGMTAGGQLNPAHSRWLMGLPIAWQMCYPPAK